MEHLPREKNEAADVRARRDPAIESKRSRYLSAAKHKPHFPATILSTAALSIESTAVSMLSKL